MFRVTDPELLSNLNDSHARNKFREVSFVVFKQAVVVADASRMVAEDFDRLGEWLDNPVVFKMSSPAARMKNDPGFVERWPAQPIGQSIGAPAPKDIGG